ncbi:hypothetical protein SODALDRAFT_284299 [Sodiomyces alkalinus F11]|uniref:Uncharacterized protein n=1 Tax=Sodiomyces alkalinus (strain CBS 110278 / VKM F-3762 / F11) TaxID=1314773 RepID=A0A3N2PLB3_SODAK|nr:hypothetical protein SODALDRAFT_284299 [Sodiomyces alkalinus F11]ROT35315.1 hypothetical protein SODALDRAFT_284299 [Sodiomyces alkalinus F11]
MAFHQPTRHSLQRVIQSVGDRPSSNHPGHLQSAEQPSPDESQTWVLFSPAAADATTSASYLSSAGESIPTPGRSQISDLGSLNTIARSNRDAYFRQSATLSAAIDDDSVEDDAELDSLDSHLPDFRTLASPYNEQPPSHHHDAAVFPTHDGLGSFRLDPPVGATEIQEQIYLFEQFNPRRVRRRRESLELAELEMQEEQEQQAHKMQRIEAWRLEQSRVLLEEIHKQTRRRRPSPSQSQSQSPSQPSTRHRTRANEARTENPGSSDPAGQADREIMDWHEEPAPQALDDRGVFAKITRKVIKDLIGIDDRLLSLLLGETLPASEDDDDLSSTPKAITAAGLATSPPPTADQSPWQIQVLDRVARELGFLISQLSPHPGAFSTYARMQEMPIPYAGLPVIPETAASPSSTALGADEVSAKMPEFKPTMPAASEPIDIPHIRDAGVDVRETATQATTTTNHPRRDETTTFTQEEWERDLDVKLVFRYLRSRFTSHTASAPAFTSGTSHLATCSTQDLAAKAARVRQHHPLVARTRPAAERRAFKATAPQSPSALRHASSCASQSTRRSARRSSVSSRHYWDIGGSLGTGSVIAGSTGPMGSWGEV